MSAYYTVCPCLFIVCMGTTPGSVTASYGWTSHQASLTSYSPEFHPEAQAGAQHAGWKKTVASVFTTDCTQGWLSALSGTSPSLRGVEHRQRRKTEGLSLASGFTCLHVKPQAQYLSLTEAGQREAFTLHPKPTGMKVTSHWPHTKVQPCSLALQLSCSESQASLVSRNAFRVHLFRMSRKIFYLCVFFLTLGLPKVPLQEPHLFLNRSCPPVGTLGAALVFLWKGQSLQSLG